MNGDYEYSPRRPQIDTIGNRAESIDAFQLIDRKRGRKILCHQGYTSDGASIPAIVQWALPKTCLGERPPHLHDLLYQSGGGRHTWVCVIGQPYSRTEADDLLVELASLEGAPAWRCRLARAALWAAGWNSWRSAPR